ncbi:hypothetical protein BH18ACT4_BH18ACT4_04080 [soil metagenome]
MDGVARVVAFLAGSWLVVSVLLSALRTVVLPRADPVVLTQMVFESLRSLFNLRVSRVSTYEERDRIMAFYAPIALVVLPGVWVALAIGGFTAVYWGLGLDPLRRAFVLSGSSMLTLGFEVPPDLVTHVASVVQASLGLGLVALVIAYLPSIYSAFQRRELGVAHLATRAGDPPSAIEMILRHHRLSRLEALDDLWDEWEVWFADVEESHTSQPSLVFFRSITHDQSWLTSAGVVLDAAAIRSSTLDLPRNPGAELCLRAGYLSLRRIAAFYRIPFHPHPGPDEPVSIDRVEFDAAYEELRTAGVPLKADRDACWNDFAGWRVNYDTPLLALSGLTMAPYAPWSSDRSLRYQRPALRKVRRRRAG